MMSFSFEGNWWNGFSNFANQSRLETETANHSLNTRIGTAHGRASGVESSVSMHLLQMHQDSTTPLQLFKEILKSKIHCSLQDRSDFVIVCTELRILNTDSGRFSSSKQRIAVMRGRFELSRNCSMHIKECSFLPLKNDDQKHRRKILSTLKYIDFISPAAVMSENIFFLFPNHLQPILVRVFSLQSHLVFNFQ
jgi:hypothetical protein